MISLANNFSIFYFFSSSVSHFSSSSFSKVSLLFWVSKSNYYSSCYSSSSSSSSSSSLSESSFYLFFCFCFCSFYWVYGYWELYNFYFYYSYFFCLIFSQSFYRRYFVLCSVWTRAKMNLKNQYINIVDLVLFSRGLMNFFTNEKIILSNRMEPELAFPKIFSKSSADVELKLFSNVPFFMLF